MLVVLDVEVLCVPSGVPLGTRVPAGQCGPGQGPVVEKGFEFFAEVAGEEVLDGHPGGLDPAAEFAVLEADFYEVGSIFIQVGLVLEDEAFKSVPAEVDVEEDFDRVDVLVCDLENSVY